MRRNLVAPAALALAFVALACGSGGNNGSVTYAATVVPIKHIDFTGVEVDLHSPIPSQFVGRYPAVVATVNGESIPGAELVSVQIIREANKRQALDPEDPRFSPELVARLDSNDPLDGLIDQTVMRQAVERLGYLPSHQEAVEATRKQQQATEDYLSQASPADRERETEQLRRDGYPEDDWATNETIVEGYRQNMGLVNLETEECRPPTTTLDYTPPDVLPTYRSPCTAFLAKERKNAKIVYYVRWAD